MAPKIGPYGAGACVDETIHHMTPLRGHGEVRGADFAKYLQQEYPGEYPEGTVPKKETWGKWLEMSQ
jgi:hypothetical protein